MAKVTIRKAKSGETFLGGKGVVIFINPCRKPDPETERLEREMEESVPHQFDVEIEEDES